MSLIITRGLGKCNDEASANIVFLDEVKASVETESKEIEVKTDSLDVNSIPLELSANFVTTESNAEINSPTFSVEIE